VRHRFPPRGTGLTPLQRGLITQTQQASTRFRVLEIISEPNFVTGLCVKGGEFWSWSSDLAGQGSCHHAQGAFLTSRSQIFA
jgi:hypothetical protein